MTTQYARVKGVLLFPIHNKQAFAMTPWKKIQKARI